MSKKPDPGLCVHCLQHSPERNWDHVIPKSWYPDTTPANLEKWKIPSCPKCNSSYGQLEQALLVRLGLCIDRKIAVASGISEKAVRALDPKSAKNEKDRRNRIAQRTAILDEMKRAGELSDEGYFPNFGPPPGVSGKGLPRVLISQDTLLKLGQKLIRGITYIDTQEVIPEAYEIQVSFPHENDVDDVTQMIKRFGKTEHRGPGVLIERARLSEDRLHALFKITLWGRVRIYGSVIAEATSKFDASSGHLRGASRSSK
jgi:hypothetical protein